MLREISSDIPMPNEDPKLQPPKDAGDAAKAFESFFLYYMLKVMRETVPKDGLLGGGAGEEIYTSLLDEQTAEGIVRRGGMGLSDLILKEMSARTESQGLPAKSEDLPSASPQTENPKAVHAGEGVFSLPIQGALSSGFGFRNHPITHEEAFHDGIDIAAREKTPVHPSQGGVVIFSGWKGGYGNTVILRHEDGYTSLYAHNQENLVNVGDQVEENQAIARVGHTGRATGPHLHFEIRKDGKPVNPLSLIV